MARFISFLFFTIALGTLPSQGAILISGDFLETQQEEIDSILRTYTGPCPKYFQNKENLKKHTEEKRVLLDKETDFVEIKFLNTLFKEKKMNAEASYVPSTLWNLYVADKHLTDEKKQKEYQYIDNLGYKEREPLHRMRYFSLSQELSEQIKKDKVGDLKGFLSLSTTYLEHIEKHKRTDNEWVSSLSGELKKIKEGKTSILVITHPPFASHENHPNK